MSDKNKDLFSLPGVLGFGYGKKETDGKVTETDALIIFVEKKLPLKKLKKDQIIPQTIEEIPTDVIEIGKIVALEQETKKMDNYEILYRFLSNTTDEAPVSGKLSPFKEILTILKKDLEKARLIKVSLGGVSLQEYKKGIKSFEGFQELFNNASKDLEKISISVKALSDINIEKYKNSFQTIKNQVSISDNIQNQIDLIKRIIAIFFPVKKNATKSRTSLVRPAMPGVSIGHYKGSSGTFGAVVYTTKNNEPMILSNNHVLANTTLTNEQNAFRNDPILQPGKSDRGTQEIGKLANLVALKPSPEVNQVDCALAKPTDPKNITAEIMEVGKVNGINEPSVGMRIKKSGRTTGLTSGTIKSINATVKVNYSGRILLFENQIIASKMSEPGDSGSLVLDMNNKAVGLLFAGSNLVTIINPIKPVLDMLEIKF